jgi:hypothetical protein
MDGGARISTSKPDEDEQDTFNRQIQIKYVSRPLASASGWMKFLAIVSVLGAIYAVVVAGWTVFWMWLQVWLAFLLWKAANGASRASDSGNDEQLRGGLDRLRLYFKISGVLALLGLTSGILGLCFALPHLAGT